MTGGGVLLFLCGSDIRYSLFDAPCTRDLRPASRPGMCARGGGGVWQSTGATPVWWWQRACRASSASISQPIDLQGGQNIGRRKGRRWLAGGEVGAVGGGCTDRWRPFRIHAATASKFPGSARWSNGGLAWRTVTGNGLLIGREQLALWCQCPAASCQLPAKVRSTRLPYRPSSSVYCVLLGAVRTTAALPM